MNRHVCTVYNIDIYRYISSFETSKSRRPGHEQHVAPTLPTLVELMAHDTYWQCQEDHRNKGEDGDRDVATYRGGIIVAIAHRGHRNDRQP